MAADQFIWLQIKSSQSDDIPASGVLFWGPLVPLIYCPSAAQPENQVDNLVPSSRKGTVAE
jgi:hypothetical protein